MENSIQKAIKKAIEAGFDFEKMEHDGLKPEVKFVRSEFEIQGKDLKKGGYLMVRAIYKDKTGREYGSWVIFSDKIRRCSNNFFLNPLFWQSLGKALGWCYHEPAFENCVCTGQTIGYYWHRFIDHLAEGKSAEDFFTELFVAQEEKSK